MRRTGFYGRGSAALAALLLLAGGAAACSGPDGPDQTLEDFLAGWRAGDLSKVGFVTADGSKISAGDVLTELQGLSGDLKKTPVRHTVEGKPKEAGEVASSPVKIDR